jgi:fructose-bisphosphate aldolase class II
VEKVAFQNADMDSILTDPELVRDFVRQTGVYFIVPTFGNLHGLYLMGGSENIGSLIGRFNGTMSFPVEWFVVTDLYNSVKNIARIITSVPLVVHGTHPVSYDLFQRAIKLGIRNININRNARDEYTKFLAENAGKLELTVLKERGVAIYTALIKRLMDFFGSLHKA